MATQAQTEIIPQVPPPLIPASSTKTPKPAAKRKKKLIRRTDRDYSQIARRSFQGAFLLLNIWIGTLFYSWVRQFEPGGVPSALARPAGVEGWLPIAGLMNLKYFVLTHHVPSLHPAGMFLLLSFLAMSFLFRKAFCSWLCPVGTISEYLWQLGRKLFRRNFFLPRWLDVGLRGLKYVLLGFFGWAVSSMAAGEIAAFMNSPYGVIADVKMLNFFRHLGQTGAIVLGVLVVASLFVQNFWCRYLCPYGALLGITSLFSPTRILRNPETCIDCAKCAKACPSILPVDQLITIKSAECTGCLECVAVCPAKDALSLSLPKIPALVPQAPKVPAWAMAAGIAVLFFGIVGFAKTAGYWDSQVPRATYQQLVPEADQARHPMPGEN
ncbi:MAG: 4Fe-4S binding protein [Acidobacteriales bacterium]|nr:4Fe-4S binding protein [Candidatus Koribacter versatilis]MBI3644902.1 4Fe-4S binding protein [Terriglobales bacterium]